MREVEGGLRNLQELLGELHDSDERDQRSAVQTEDGDLHETLRGLHEPGQRNRRDQILVVSGDQFDRSQVRKSIATVLKNFQIIEAVDVGEALRHIESDMAERLAFMWTDNILIGKMRGIDLAEMLRGREIRGRSLSAEKVRTLERVPIKLVVSDENMDKYENHVGDGVIQHVAVNPFHLKKTAENIRIAAMRMAGGNT